jgi:hypothetical protein
MATLQTAPESRTVAINGDPTKSPVGSPFMATSVDAACDLRRFMFHLAFTQLIDQTMRFCFRRHRRR